MDRRFRDDMNDDQDLGDEDSPSPSRRLGVGWAGLLILTFLIGGVAATTFMAPYFRQARTVKITLQDKAGAPIRGATMSIMQRDASFAPLLLLRNPSRMTDFTTDAKGQVQFETRDSYVRLAMMTLGNTLLIQLSATTELHMKGGGTRKVMDVAWSAASEESIVAHDTVIVVARLGQ